MSLCVYWNGLNLFTNFNNKWRWWLLGLLFDCILPWHLLQYPGGDYIDRFSFISFATKLGIIPYEHCRDSQRERRSSTNNHRVVAREAALTQSDEIGDTVRIPRCVGVGYNILRYTLDDAIYKVYCCVINLHSTWKQQPHNSFIIFDTRL